MASDEGEFRGSVRGGCGGVKDDPVYVPSYDELLEMCGFNAVNVTEFGFCAVA